MPYLTDMYHDQNATVDGAAYTTAHGPTPLGRDGLIDRLSSRILGQAEAVEAVARAVSIARVGFGDPDRPLASVLLVGPTGVGKTELVRQLAAELRSGRDDLCRIDMSALAQEHYAASLSGAPPGYAGSKESFTLFDRGKIEGDPYTPGIVLLDEIEKADSTVIRALLHILDTGELRLANGRDKISFRNCYIFMTSNLGSQHVAAELRADAARRWWARLAGRGASGDTSRLKALVQDSVENFFDPEFFNRIDETVILNPITPAVARDVTRREVHAFADRIARESVTLRITASALDVLQGHGFDPVYGARGLGRTLRHHLIAPVAECVQRIRPVGRAPITLEARAEGGSIQIVPVVHT